MQDYYFGAQRKSTDVFFSSGYGVCEKDGWPRICRIQQCHVSAFQNRVGVFCIYLPPFSTSMSEKTYCVMGLVHYLLHY